MQVFSKGVRGFEVEPLEPLQAIKILLKEKNLRRGQVVCFLFVKLLDLFSSRIAQQGVLSTGDKKKTSLEVKQGKF